MFPSKFLQFPSILTHFHAANEKIQNGGRDLAISRGLVWVNMDTFSFFSREIPETFHLINDLSKISDKPLSVNSLWHLIALGWYYLLVGVTGKNRTYLILNPKQEMVVKIRISITEYGDILMFFSREIIPETLHLINHIEKIIMYKIKQHRYSFMFETETTNIIHNYWNYFIFCKMNPDFFTSILLSKCSDKNQYRWKSICIQLLFM